MTGPIVHHVDREEWRPVAGFEGMYEVSDLGRVRSLTRWVPTKRENAPSYKIKGRLLRGCRGPDGYITAVLFRGRERTAIRVSRLVLQTFVGPCPTDMEACHNDGDRANNALTNLRWDTKSANRLDQQRHGTDYQANKTHCRHGHPYDEENTEWRRTGGRACLACRAASHQREPA
jgi:hypothetical protein